MSVPKLVIVVPCYNEEEVLPQTAKCLSAKISQLVSKKLISDDSSVLFVDDGSKDNTWKIIERFCREEPAMFKRFKLEKNAGHQYALLYGLIVAFERSDCKADVTVSIDADLQDDVDAIDKMLELYAEGNDIVCGVRNNRKTDGFFKRVTAGIFYLLMRLLGVKMIYNHSDFRLMNWSVLEELLKKTKANVFLRTDVLKLGHEPVIVYYDRKKRLAGKSKYTLRKMAKLAWDGFKSM